MSTKGGKVDASGEFIKSVRLVTDIDADSGIGTATDPLRVDPTGTTVQPVSFSGGISVTNFPGTQPVSGTVAVSNLPATQPVSGTVTANQGGTWTDRIVGNAGATLDATVAAGTAPTNGVAVLAQANTSAPAPTNGQTHALQSDIAGNLRINPTGNVGSYTFYTQTKAGNLQNTLTVPAGKKWRVMSMLIKVTTSSTVANRTPSIYTQSAATDVFTNINAGVVTTASLTTYYVFSPFVPLSSTLTNSCATVPYPQLSLGPGSTVNGSLNLGVAGDSFVLTVTVEEYNA